MLRSTLQVTLGICWCIKKSPWNSLTERDNGFVCSQFSGSGIWAELSCDSTSSLGALGCGWKLQNGAWPLWTWPLLSCWAVRVQVGAGSPKENILEGEGESSRSLRVQASKVNSSTSATSRLSGLGTGRGWPRFQGRRKEILPLQGAVGGTLCKRAGSMGQEVSLRTPLGIPPPECNG